MPARNTAELIPVLFTLKKAIFGELRKNIQLNPADFLHAETLHLIKDHGHPQMKEVANFFGIKRPSATSLVKKLIKQKYIVRQANPKDRRAVHLIITKKGKTFVAAIDKKTRQAMALTLRKLSRQDINDLVRIYQKLINSINK